MTKVYGYDRMNKIKNYKNSQNRQRLIDFKHKGIYIE